MNDLLWERTAPHPAPAPDDLAEALRPFDAGLRIVRLQPVAIGCRNANYILTTDKGLFFLRLIDGNGAAEQLAARLLAGCLPLPALYFAGSLYGRCFLLYGHIPGKSLQTHILEQGGCSPEIAVQAARAAATLHSVYSMLEKQAEAVRAIGCMEQVPIHADFRPANMLLDPAGKLYVADWEGFGPGHALGDVGQFFRFREQFSPEGFRCFAEAYNGFAKTPLPENWESLALLRDLVNPLQLLGMDWDAPRAKADLTALVAKTVECLE